MKRSLESSYDFTFKKAFQAIDDWTYGYLDQNNLKRFLRSTGHVSTKHELVSILRRFDIDGDAKINFKEFELGFKSSLTVFGKSSKKACRPRSGVATKVSRMQHSPSRKNMERQ
jgi:Ca2+-binding EF-hand superfamily protein